jgi:hypothetical protein
LFQNAAGIEIVGGQFLAVAGDVHHHHPVRIPIFDRSRLMYTCQRNSVPLPLNIMDENSESELYCNQLLRRKRGFPLYVPGPPQNLPAEYQRNGVAIGDVGRITPEGIFDFFFNIYLPASHPINDNDVPDKFCPLPHYASKDIFDLH